MTADELYHMGNMARREGRFADAMNLYAEAIKQDPNSPALTAREMLTEQFNFYSKDMYNP